MSRSDILEAQTTLVDSGLTEANLLEKLAIRLNLSLPIYSIPEQILAIDMKDIQFAVQGLILQDFFRTENFKEMQAELTQLTPTVTQLGVSLVNIETESTEIFTRHLNNCSRKFFNQYPRFVPLLEQKDIRTEELFAATGTGMSVLTDLARDTLHRNKSLESFARNYKHIVRHGASLLANQSAQVVSGDEISLGLFETPKYLRDKIKTEIYKNFTSPERFKSSLLACIDSFDAKKYYNKDSQERYYSAREFVINLNPLQMDTFMKTYIEITPYGDQYPTVEDLDLENLHSNVVSMLSTDSIIDIVRILPNIRKVLLQYDNKLDFLEPNLISSVKILREDFVILEEGGGVNIDIAEFKKRMRNRRTDTHLTILEEQLKVEGTLVVHGCPGLHERTQDKDETTGRRVSLIDVAAHSIATVIAKNWELIQKIGYL